MNNVDVPLWDKGDKTDDYSKGGGSSAFRSDSTMEDSVIVRDLYELVLNRMPTSSELSYYRYIEIKPEEIVRKLINTQEHKNLVLKGRDFPQLEEREREDQTTILKLKHKIEDREAEFAEMADMLERKNKEILYLREEKNIPFVSESFLEPSKEIYYTPSEKSNSTPLMNRNLSWLDKLSDIINRLSK